MRDTFYIILHKKAMKMIVDVDKLDAIYCDQPMYCEFLQTHVVVNGVDIVCEETPDEIFELLKQAKEGRPNE